MVQFSFKMETIQSILHLVEKNSYQTCIDVTDALLTVPVKIKHQIFWKFSYKGKLYQYMVLPFGYTGSPRIFTKIFKPLLAKLQSLGMIFSVYLDDSWQGGRTFKECLQNCIKTFCLIQDCGFIPKLSKCSLFPKQIMEILGMMEQVYNTDHTSVYLCDNN